MKKKKETKDFKRLNELLFFYLVRDQIKISIFSKKQINIPWIGGQWNSQKLTAKN